MEGAYKSFEDKCVCTPCFNALVRWANASRSLYLAARQLNSDVLDSIDDEAPYNKEYQDRLPADRAELARWQSAADADSAAAAVACGERK